MNRLRENNKGIKSKDIRCPNGHKVAEARGECVVIKCRCKHLVKVDMKEVKNI